MTDGFVFGGTVLQIPGIECVSFRAVPGFTLKLPEDGRKRTTAEKPSFAVFHNTIGDLPNEVLPGLGPKGQGSRVARYLHGSPRNAGVHVVFEPDGSAICMADIETVAAYGAGHKRANALGVQFELAALPRPGGGQTLFQGQVDAAALFVEACAERFGWDRVACAPRPRNRCLVRALSAPSSTLLASGDHCVWTRARDLGDTGFVLQPVLRDKYGWRIVDFDATETVWPEAPPSWLLPEDEILPTVQTEGGSHELAQLVETFHRAGLGIVEALHLGAHGATESGLCLRDEGFNYFGWKARREWAEGERAAGRRARWWRRFGHVASGDREVCYYRAFDSMEHAVKTFLPWFAPRTPEAERLSRGLYAKAGRALAAKDGQRWFEELLAAGYRGDRTAEHPEESLADHQRVVQEAAECWLQAQLGVAVDGVWGPKSRGALQGRVGSGDASPAACEALAKSVRLA